MAPLPKPDHRMTVEEFLVWHDTQEVRYQLWDGEVFPVHPVEDDQAPAARAAVRPAMP